MAAQVEYITPEQMMKEEARAASLGIGVGKLMENAGSEVALEVERRYGPLFGRRVLVVAGSGNNGGDGFVAARHLAARGSKVKVLLLSSPEAIRTKEAETNWKRLSESPVEMLVARDGSELTRLGSEFERAEIVIDAIFGTGIRGEVREPHATAIRLLNASRAKKVALDIPSGLDPLTGEAKGTTVKADVTIALHKAKVGLRRRSEFTGQVVVVPIGIP
ncbi:MAG TPA: NAD(P)H-hydrate epimerase [Nitrososphaerales archaeon]|nr:NAD(P)H-hydrate epimerase [Nitrososphaerales archaeon]